MNDYQFWLSQGICPHCHHRKIAPGRHACPECLAKMRKREAASRQRAIERKKTDPDFVDRQAENRRNAVRAYRERHKAAGLCVYCSNKALPGIQLCERHRRKTSVWNRRKYDGRTKPPREHLEPPTPMHKTKVDLGKLFALYNAGWKYKDIVAEMRICESTVSYWVRKAKEAADAKVS